MLKQTLLAVSFFCVAAAIPASAIAAGAAPPGLEKMRKAFSVAVAKQDVKGVAAMTQFPLAFSGYEHPDKVTAAQFADEFQGLFGGGDAQIVKCLAKGKLATAETKFPNSPWVIDCDGNEYYFGQRGGKWKFTAYENVNE
ncbi:MAG: hypothetical protein U1E67_17465 [Hyphomicrobiales bacterium]